MKQGWKSIASNWIQHAVRPTPWVKCIKDEVTCDWPVRKSSLPVLKKHLKIKKMPDQEHSTNSADSLQTIHVKNKVWFCPNQNTTLGLCSTTAQYKWAIKIAWPRQCGKNAWPWWVLTLITRGNVTNHTPFVEWTKANNALNTELTIMHWKSTLCEIVSRARGALHHCDEKCCYLLCPQEVLCCWCFCLTVLKF